jgi:IMP dehydrogenase/GMP reductase
MLYLEKPLKYWEGEIDVLNSESGITLYVGQSATIEKNILRRYYQVGAKEIIVELIKLAYVPGNINFERAMKIMRGFHKDGLYTQLNIQARSLHYRHNRRINQLERNW